MKRRRFRSHPDRRVPALAAAASLTALGTLGAWWAVAMLLDQQSPPVLHTLQALTWDSTAVVGVAMLAGLVGVTFILVSLVPGRAILAETVPSKARPEHTTAVTTRGLVRIAAGEAERTHGASSFHANGGRSQLRVRVGAAARERAQVQTALRGRIITRVRSLGLQTAPRIRVSTFEEKKSR